ncbi:hypothetical protein QFZ75_004143 [Streptomyces sp. V3I8]|nr:DUF397 domain-containing protein [Streptomyces sp. V3I8]MDQ1037727.1 hypothetical protein [Streptomyces sp. V3I8]
MPELSWQKSSFSGGPQGNCLYIATAPQCLAGLLQHVRAQGNG